MSGALAAIAGNFRTEAVVAAAPVPGGHIHRSWRVETPAGAFLLQRLNRRVFPRPELVMENVARVTGHLGGPLRLVPTLAGEAAHVDAAGEWWRLYEFIEGAVTRDTVTSAADAYAAARAFGEFQRRLGGYAGPRLHATIPGFHDTPRRLAAFEAAVRADRAGRAAGCRAEIEALLARRALAPVL
ncbi:MAG TPA: phosphotransferase, partial [Gemmatimonadales bacterium]|nr:phosphotransferase [Gemmatimonadales bacterium]